MRRSARVWRYGTLREAAANLKVVSDLAVHWWDRRS
jgi:hypothetical protein